VKERKAEYKSYFGTALSKLMVLTNESHFDLSKFGEKSKAKASQLYMK